ncbi:MAG: twin-arginine translocase TatA/TatE family subunit [Chthoniobacterales bacterium]|nr:twin-arginine translocase TatA/TatE family subunit [Chthoniobacterales bacterium]
MISSFIASSPLFLAFGIPSGPDLIVLLIIVLVLFGAKRLPEIARSLGQSVHEFKKAKQEFEEAANAKPTSAIPPTGAPVATPTVASAASEEPKASQQS